MPRAFSEQEKTQIRTRLLEAGGKQFAAYGLRKTTVDELLNGGKKAIAFRGVLKAEAMFEGVRCLAKMGELLGKQNILYRYAVEGLSEKMNSDVEAMLNDPNLLECLVAEAMICNLRGGYYLDRSDIKKSFQHEKWANIVDEYAQKHGIL